jgi:hypothetical protein
MPATGAKRRLRLSVIVRLELFVDASSSRVPVRKGHCVGLQDWSVLTIHSCRTRRPVLFVWAQTCTDVLFCMGGCGARGLIWLLGLLTCAVLGRVRALLEKPLGRCSVMSLNHWPLWTADGGWQLLPALLPPLPAQTERIRSRRNNKSSHHNNSTVSGLSRSPAPPFSRL